jgi:hypothetical protein
LRESEAAESGGWLAVDLASSTGAVAVLHLGSGPARTRWATAGDSYQSSSDPRLFFGLGDAAPTALELVPAAGGRRRIVRPPAGRFLRFARE